MINLHTHTNKSLDGVYEVNELLNMCEKEKINYVSITDHDTCSAYAEIGDNHYTGKIVYGLEADALIGKETYDILCYNFDIEKVTEWTKKQYKTLEERQTIIFQALKDKCMDKGILLDETIPYNPKEEYAHAAIFRMLEAEFKEKNHIEKVNDLYRESTINENFPLYINMSIVWPTIEEVKDIIHENRGLIFLAHPFRYGTKDVKELLEEAKPFIDGIEVYNNNTEEETQFLYQYAKDNNLYISCGSDFHGDEKHHEIKVEISNEIQEEVKTWIKK